MDPDVIIPGDGTTSIHSVHLRPEFRWNGTNFICSIKDLQPPVQRGTCGTPNISVECELAMSCNYSDDNNYYNKKQDCLSRVVMVTDEKPQILNCNIQFYFKWIVQTITFKLWNKTQFKCNGLFYWFWNRIEYYNLIFAVFHLWPLQLLINNPVFYYNICCFSTEIQMNYFILRSSKFWGLILYWLLTLKSPMRS